MPAVLLLLLLAGSLAITAALVAFQRYVHASSEETTRTTSSTAAAQLLQHPERVLVSGIFLNTTLHLFLAICAFEAVAPLVGALQAPRWSLLAGITLVLSLVLLLARTAAAAWARNQKPQADPPLLSVLQSVTVLGQPFASAILFLQQMTSRSKAVFGVPNASEELSITLDKTSSEPNSPEEKGLLKAIVNFSSITVRQIMRARVDIIAFDRRMSFKALLKQINQWGYSRVPVYTDGLDKIDGILYVKDLLPYLNAPSDFVWQNLIRTPYFVPETNKIDELLREFQERHVHMAIVVNEYGDTTGLLTMEDVIEEIVGEIHDELDDEEDQYYTQLDEHTFLFEARTSLHDFCKIMNPPAEMLKEVRGEVESVAGLMLRLFARIPHTGEECQLGSYLFRIEAADSKRIKKVRVQEVVPHPENEEK